MRLLWDYTDLAASYNKRPNYANGAIQALLKYTHISAGAKGCDIGAGTGHLTARLSEASLNIVVIEPNDAMREIGVQRTKKYKNVNWHTTTGEDTQQPENDFELVTFGSSFNVVDQQQVLKETARILKPRGWFACMWNHRQLEDPIQSQIEDIIKDHVTGYSYGTRREDQTGIINTSGLFGSVVHLGSCILHKQTIGGMWKLGALMRRLNDRRAQPDVKF